MNGVDFPVAKVLDGIAAAREAGLGPIKVNMVVRRGINESSVVPMARWARTEGLILRFIEYMDVGHTNGWRMDEVVPAAEIVAADRRRRCRSSRSRRATPARSPTAGATSTAVGEVGVIASVTRPFCGACTRARLSADGQLYTCLFASEGTTCARLRRGRAPRTTTLRRRDRCGLDGRGPIATPSCGPRRPADLPRVEMFAMGG